MPMYNVLGNSCNYSMTSTSLRNYHRNKVNDGMNKKTVAYNYRINNNKAATIRSFEYNTKLIESAPVDNTTLDAEVAVPLKHLCNFWRSHNLSVINCEIELDLSCLGNCIGSKISRKSAVATNPTFVPPTP